MRAERERIPILHITPYKKNKVFLLIKKIICLIKALLTKPLAFISQQNGDDRRTSLQTFSFWKGFNKFYPRLLALICENTTERKKRPLPPPNHVLV
jgi:hypothetical protein